MESTGILSEGKHRHERLNRFVDAQCSQVAQGGLEMKNAYAASTMCGTSRYSTLTGRLPSRSAYGRYMDAESFQRDVIIPLTKLEDLEGWGRDCTEDNLAAILQKNGYSTGVVGKWHLSSDEDIAAYDDDDYYYYDSEYSKIQEKIKECGFDFAEAIYKENLRQDQSWTVNSDGDPVTHNMEHVTSEAIRFIEESSSTSSSLFDGNSTKPFFLYFNPTVPHFLADVTDALEFADCKETVEGTLSESPPIPYGMTADYPNCKKYRKSVLKRARSYTKTFSQNCEDYLFECQEDKIAGAVWIDDAMGSIIQTLEANEILNNTVILFQLDHGMDAKGTVFEGGSRIPQFVHYPDRFRPSTMDSLVSTIDVAPTFLELARIPSVYPMDGESWLSKIENPDDRCVFVEEGLDRSVRCGCYKYVWIANIHQGQTVEKAVEQGLVLGTHNFFYLCEDNSGGYVEAPLQSPELLTQAYAKRMIPKEIRTQLKDKLECLLAQTDPMTSISNVTADCGAPIVIPEEPVVAQDFITNSTIVLGPTTVETTATTFSPTPSPSASPTITSTESSQTLLVDHSKSIIVASTLLGIVVLGFLWWSYRTLCRKVPPTPTKTGTILYVPNTVPPSEQSESESSETQDDDILPRSRTLVLPSKTCSFHRSQSLPSRIVLHNDEGTASKRDTVHFIARVPSFDNISC